MNFTDRIDLFKKDFKNLLDKYGLEIQGWTWSNCGEPKGNVIILDREEDVNPEIFMKLEEDCTTLQF